MAKSHNAGIVRRLSRSASAIPQSRKHDRRGQRRSLANELTVPTSFSVPNPSSFRPPPYSLPVPPAFAATASIGCSPGSVAGEAATMSAESAGCLALRDVAARQSRHSFPDAMRNQHRVPRQLRSRPQPHARNLFPRPSKPQRRRRARTGHHLTQLFTITPP